MDGLTFSDPRLGLAGVPLSPSDFVTFGSTALEWGLMTSILLREKSLPVPPFALPHKLPSGHFLVIHVPEILSLLP